MKHFTLWIFISLFMCQIAMAQDFTTPNTGITYSLDDIIAESPSTLSSTGDVYTLVGNLTISENDALVIDTDVILEIASAIRITVYGTFTVDSDDVTITAVDTNAPYDGFRFEEFSVINIQNATISYGGGLRVLTETFTINNCTITNNYEGTTTGGVISLSRGVPVITNNTITFNFLPAISSGANIEVSPYIANNYIEGNNQENSNRPQINLGITKTTDSLKILQNTIIGDPTLDQVGGIAVANFIGGNIRAIIDDNVITDNRYGITVAGNNSFAYIRNNILEDNNTQGSPNLGGSGISINTSSAPMEIIASGNAIRGNLWGITVIGQASINLGDGDENPGQNVFADNGNGGVTYALYNNTPNPIMAMNNCWDENNLPNTLATAEDVIVHQNDIGTLGLVTFDPVNCEFLSVVDSTFATTKLYPNPSSGRFFIDNIAGFESLTLYGLDGKHLLEQPLTRGTNTMDVQLPSGIYFVALEQGEERLVKKLVIQ